MPFIQLRCSGKPTDVTGSELVLLEFWPAIVLLVVALALPLAAALFAGRARLLDAITGLFAVATAFALYVTAAVEGTLRYGFYGTSCGILISFWGTSYWRKGATDQIFRKRAIATTGATFVVALAALGINVMYERAALAESKLREAEERVESAAEQRREAERLRRLAAAQRDEAKSMAAQNGRSQRDAVAAAEAADDRARRATAAAEAAEERARRAEEELQRLKESMNSSAPDVATHGESAEERKRRCDAQQYACYAPCMGMPDPWVNSPRKRCKDTCSLGWISCMGN